MAKFRESKYPAIVSAVLSFDDASYIEWAKDIGYTPPEEPIIENEEEGISPRYDAEYYVNELGEEVISLYDELVPESGSANTLQGELIRAMSRLEGEFYRNLFMNWGDGSNYYEDLLELVYITLINESSFSKLIIKIIDADVMHIKNFCNSNSSDEEIEEPQQLTESPHFEFGGIEDMCLPRLNAVVSCWCKKHKELIPYKL